MHYNFWFAFHVNNNGPFALTEKHKFQLSHQSMKQIQERKCNKRKKKDISKIIQGHFLT